MPRNMPAAMTSKQCSNEISALEEHQQQQHEFRQKELSEKNHLKQTLARHVSGVQPIHIISSDEDEAIDAAHSSYSGQQGFAGFGSPGSNMQHVTPVTSCRSLRQRHAALPKESNSGALGFTKRSSLGSRKSADCVSAAEFDKMLPIKRKKEQCNKDVEGMPFAAENMQLPPNMQTPPPDQVVEVSSNSTTHSQRQKRLQRRCAQQPNIQQMQNTKCSTETSSEFPVSSPSNPQPGGCKFPQRPPLLKNTLPADSFERQLAIVAARNPQMTLADKMHAWKCETELSDVEDVNEFDARFQTAEEKKRKMSKCIKNKEPVEDDYDFQHFRYVVLKNLKSQMNMSQQLEDECDKPSTSAAAAAQLRRQDVKKTRPPKEQTQQKKKTQSSTTPAPASSSASISASSHGSSEYLVAGNSYGRKKNSIKINTPPKLQMHDEVLCPSSSTDASMHVACMSLKPSATCTAATTATTKLIKDVSIQSPPKKSILNDFTADGGTNAQLGTTPLNLHWTSTEEESVFRLHRLNREIDKTRYETSNKTEPKRLIQMHLDFMAEKKKLNLREKKGELFKTPIVPTKYSPNSPHSQQQENQLNHSNSNNKNNSNSNINNNNNTDTYTGSKGNEIDIHDSTFPSFISPSVSSDMYDYTKSAKDLAELAMPISPTADQHQGMHQQHEFCSYLGLTGMSTANAVANAVAELARSNIARRSLRVRRQQHVQEKQEKNCREQKQLEALKLKQLREIKRRDRPIKGSLDEINNHIPKTEVAESMIESKSYEQKMASKNVLLNNIQTLAQAVPQSLTPIKESKKEPEIKIICHIAADDQTEVQKLSKKYVKKITDPIRNTLIRHINQGNSTTGVATTPPATDVDCPQPLVETANEDVKKENIATDISEHLKTESSSSLPTDPVNSVIQIKHEHKESQCQIDAPARSSVAESAAKIEELLLANTQEKLHLKFQEYLEASRRAKPSIYIVQSIDNDKEMKKKIIFTELLKGDSAVETTLGNPMQYETGTRATKEFSSMDNMKMDPRLSGGTVEPKRKVKKHLSKLLTRSVLNMSQQRQLRNRKIVILKTIKRKTLKSRSKEKKLKKSKHSLQNKESSSHISKLELKKSSTARRRHTAVINKVAQANDIGNESADVRHVTVLYEQSAKLKESTVELKPIEHELVVVSSTTNCYDEQHGTKERSNNTPESVASQRTFVLNDDIVYTKESATQCAPAPTNGICQLTPPSSPMRNPLKVAQGKVLHIYFELDVLIVVQEMLLSFWKYSKLLVVLNVQMTTMIPATSPHQSKQFNNQHQRQQHQEAETSSPPLDALGEWMHLGECKRLQYDEEISTPYANRICIHNSIPIYVEMRCKELQKERRDCNLLSLYINIYFYNDEEMHAKMHSIQLDAVQSLPLNVIYTTITDSRYFVMSWPQENIMGKIRSGLCKYSLTPHLDTLASIREFKSMRHEVRYLECTDDDKLVGFGVTQLTIWDHRSGDVLMNYDLGLNLGRNLGSIYYPSLEIGQNSMILLFQLLPYMKESVNNEQNDAIAAAKCISHSEVHVIVCSISHVTPSHRVLYRHTLPSPTFIHLSNAINSGEHLLLTASNDEEIWISCDDPKMMTLVPAQHSQRFYARGRSQLIELTERTLSVDCFANHVLKISAATI